LEVGPPVIKKLVVLTKANDAKVQLQLWPVSPEECSTFSYDFSANLTRLPGIF